MIKVRLDRAHLNENILDYQSAVDTAHNWLHEHNGKGYDYTGWVEWPVTYDKEEFARIKEVGKEIHENADVFLVCGIGGSYLGARSAIEFMQGLYPDRKPEIIFVGNTFSSTYIAQVMKHIEGKSVYVDVISKSGTTTETSISFRLLKQYVEKNFPGEASKRIIATTDKHKGTLKALADKEGYREFVVPDNIGGRYSVFTAVGLLPIAAAGIDIDELMKGSYDAMKDLAVREIDKNPAYQYAVARRILENMGYTAEMFVSYDLGTTMMAEWWKQLFGESEGKDGKGILPVSATFSTDLHSMGQFIQQGKKVLFETLLNVEKPLEDIIFPDDAENLDGMNYLSGKSIAWVNKMAMEGTLDAHEITGNVPNIIVNLPDQTAYSYGYLIYFFFLACGVTCYMLDINPFNQPGVEVYKKNMFKLLGKPE